MLASIVLIAVFIYIIMLFSIARWGDRKQYVKSSRVRHPMIYALALGVYCTSWTFYGLVGTAADKGWEFLPILLGPVLLFTVGFPLLERINRVCKQEYIHSLADFVASRYGKRQGVAATVSIVGLIATIPYIALQLKAVSDTVLITVGDKFLVNQDMTFIIAVSMIVFAQLFGVRRLDVSGYHSGLMTTIAFESLVKIGVMFLIAGFGLYLMIDTVPPVDYSLKTMFSWEPSWLRFLVDAILSICAIFCLPRMFHVTFVECVSDQHLRQSRPIFVSYLMLVIFCIVVIAWVGNSYFLNDSQVGGDTYAIALPLTQGYQWLAVLAFLGGFSAATAMIIVATVTVSQMLSNDVIVPLLMKRNQQLQPADYSKSLIFARRFTVVIIVLAGYAYQVFLAGNAALTSIGLTAFALTVQLAPGVLFGLYWRKGNARGLYAGLIVGVSLWFYTLMIPLLNEAGLIGSSLIEDGLLGISWLRPENLLGFNFGDAFSRGVIFSLGANVVFYIWFSLTAVENLSDRIQAMAFTRFTKTDYDSYDDINFDDLHALLSEFLGPKSTTSLFSMYEQDKNSNARRELVSQAQKILAGTVGVASTQALIDSLRTGKKMAVEEVVNLFGETAKALRFNQEVLFSAFENISSGISVVDRDMCMIAWNHRYETLFEYPPDFLKVGLNVADIMRFNGERGLLGEGNINEMISKRLALMSTGNSYRVIRVQESNTVIEIKGRPLPNGGFVTTYDDITEFIATQRQLEDANMHLEHRVQERTQTIEKINRDLRNEIDRRRHIEDELREAKWTADEANASKTKFLALAGHDILQPLNAANLYAGTMIDSQKFDPEVMEHLQRSIQNTESIISSLLEIAKLDTGAFKPKSSVFSLGELIDGVVSQALVQKPEDIELHYVSTSLVVQSDKHYLQRIVQNFLVNAIKYTEQGKVLIGCRRKTVDGHPWVEICILDNGPGISEVDQSSIFGDFYRAEPQKNKVPGVGLGLSVVRRFADLLDHPVHCRSQVGKGSCFSVMVPVSKRAVMLSQPAPVVPQGDELHGLPVCYLDDDPQNLKAMTSLLTQWGCEIHTFNHIDELRAYCGANPESPPKILLVDYQLGDDHPDGLEVAQEMLVTWQNTAPNQRIAVCVVSAANDEDLPKSASYAGYGLLPKPLKPAKLRAWMTQAVSKL